MKKNPKNPKRMTPAEAREYLGLPSLRQIRAEYRAKKRAELMAIPREKRQAFMDKIHAGATIGESADAIGVDTGLACQILRLNEKVLKITTFRKESL